MQAVVRPILNQPGLYECTYVPKSPGLCKLDVAIDGVSIEGAPFNLDVRPASEPDRVRIVGAGLRGPVQASLPSTFTIDATEAGPGDLTLDLTVR